MTDLTQIKKVADSLNNDLEEVRRQLRNIQSVKSNLKKKKHLVNYNAEMNEILRQEQVLKEVRQYLEPKDKFVTQFTQADVDQLDYDQTVKALKSIQSKKTNSQFLTERIEDNIEYQNAVKIEEMLKKHRAEIKPVDEDIYIRKTDLQTMIEMFESTDITKKMMIKKLKELI